MTNQVDWKGIRTFLLLNFVPTWTLWIGMLAAGVRFDQLTTTGTLMVAASMWFPGLAAIITRKFITREGFATAGFRFGSWKPYIGFALAVPVLFGAAYALSMLIGSAQLDLTLNSFLEQMSGMLPAEAVEELAAAGPTLLLIPMFLSIITVAAAITALATAGEEIGWTGYLLPKLIWVSSAIG